MKYNGGATVRRGHDHHPQTAGNGEAVEHREDVPGPRAATFLQEMYGETAASQRHRDRDEREG
jgi:hypothetical protein